jgi:hypothetical protein
MEDFKFQLTAKGFLINRESCDLEYKEKFHYGDSLLEYLRSMAGMANNRGGKIIFGVKNSPRLPVGLDNPKFQELDSNKINQLILEYYSHDFDWDVKTIEFNNLEFGQFNIFVNDYKPIICRKSFKNILREGAIYYRYRGETREIKYTELARILDDEREKERKLWLSHVEKISQVGPKNIHLMDTYNGEITYGRERILIDSELLKRIKFIKEGTFAETGGEPTLTLAGKITGILDTSGVIPTDKAYPYRASDIEHMFNLNSYHVLSLFWKLKIKDNPKYHDKIKIGQNAFANKYSESLVTKIANVLDRYPDYVKKACLDYSEYQRQKLRNKHLG